MTDLETILELHEGSARTAALAAWVQELYSKGSPRPVLVGGAAVELLTGGAYTTGDLDFVGEVPSDVESKLKEHGFERHGRHWVHEKGQIFLEFPGDRLEAPETSLEINFDGSIVEILSPEAVLVDRLASWAFWHSEVDALNAVLLWRATERSLDRKILRELVRQRKLEETWEEFLRFMDSVSDRKPTEEELEKWIRDSRH
ncbi:MAG: hypothetical protein GWP16_04555 [Nitrospirae bacterium]|nr:hypothetical protein [Nitrospirota bacterium]